eukprot:5891661-Prymnesium_polylepis.1
MADSEQDDMYEDAVGSGDEEQRVKTRKTASGRVLIHSKEGTTFKHLALSPHMPCCWAATSSTARCCS